VCQSILLSNLVFSASKISSTEKDALTITLIFLVSAAALQVVVLSSVSAFRFMVFGDDSGRVAAQQVKGARTQLSMETELGLGFGETTTRRSSIDRPTLSELLPVPSMADGGSSFEK
jgi:hypothetical protein